MTRLPKAPTYFHKPVSALNSHGGAVVRPRGLPLAQLRGRDRRRHRPHLPERRSRRGGGVHRRLHDRQRLRAARLPRHRRGLHAPRQGQRHARPGRSRPRDRLGLPGQDPAHLRQRARRPGGVDRRDGVGHALPRRRHRPDHHARPRRPALHRHARELAPRRAGRRRRGRGRRAGPAHQPRRRGAHPGPRRRRRAAELQSEEVVSTALGGDWEFRGVRTPSKDLYPSLVDTGSEEQK